MSCIQTYPHNEHTRCMRMETDRDFSMDINDCGYQYQDQLQYQRRPSLIDHSTYLSCEMPMISNTKAPDAYACPYPPYGQEFSSFHLPRVPTSRLHYEPEVLYHPNEIPCQGDIQCYRFADNSRSEAVGFNAYSIAPQQDLPLPYPSYYKNENPMLDDDVYVPMDDGPCNYECRDIHRSCDWNGSGDSNCFHALYERISMPTAIEEKRYDIVHQKLSRKALTHQCSSVNQLQYQQMHGQNDPNEEIIFTYKQQRQVHVYMTGLEYSVFEQDWKMAILFYIHSADPAHNCFDGRVLKVREEQRLFVNAFAVDTSPLIGKVVHESDAATTTGSFSTHFLSKFKNTNGLPVSGFKGLYCLLGSCHDEAKDINHQNYEKTFCSLWLMEQCHSDHRTRQRRQVMCFDMLHYTRHCMIAIGAGSVWNNEFCCVVYELLRCLRNARGSIMASDTSMQMGTEVGTPISMFDVTNDDRRLPNDICLHILDYLVDDLALHTIWKGLKYVSECAVSMGVEMRE